MRKDLTMKFSVIIPVYNKASSIQATLDSVFAQTCQDFELIVVDDGSSDNLGEVLSPYADSIRLIRQTNAGVAAARNRGIEASRGEFVCFLDADDTWMPNHLAALEEAMGLYPAAQFLSTLYVSTFADGSSKSKLPLLSALDVYTWMDDYFDLVLKTSSTIIHTDTVCIHRTLLQAQRFQEGERIGEDTDLWYRIAAYHPLLLIKRETAVYHRESSTATQSGNNNLDWAFARRERQLLEDASIPAEKRRHIALLIDRWRCTCCRELLLQGSRKEAVKRLRAVRYRWQKRVLVCGVLCCLPRAVTGKLLANHK